MNEFTFGATFLKDKSVCEFSAIIGLNVFNILFRKAAEEKGIQTLNPSM